MVVVGVALAAGLSAVVHWVLVRASIYQAQDALIWLSGSLNTVTWTDILRMLALDALLVPLLLVLAARLPVLGLGDDLAAGLGVRVGRLRVGVTVVVVTLVAAATAVVGPIAFVGFLSGPIARRLVPGGRPSASPRWWARSSSSPPTTSPPTASPAPRCPSASSPAPSAPLSCSGCSAPDPRPRRADDRDRDPRTRAHGTPEAGGGAGRLPAARRGRPPRLRQPGRRRRRDPRGAHGPDHGRRRPQRVRQVDAPPGPGSPAPAPRRHGAPRRRRDRLAAHP